MYHSAPLFYCMSTMRLGGTVIVMEQFDRRARSHTSSSTASRTASGCRRCSCGCSSSPTRCAHVTTSRRSGSRSTPAAPCSVEMKRKMIEWWGPIIDEYYAATEGMGATYISSTDWLAHPDRSAAPCSARSASSTTRTTSSRRARSAPCGSSRPPTGPASSTTRTRRRPRDSFNDRGLVHRRRHGLPRRRGLPLPHRSPHLHDRVGRREHLPARSGERAHRPPEGLRRRRVRHPRPGDGRARARRGAADQLERQGPRARTGAARLLQSQLAKYKCPKAIDFDRELPREQTGKLYKRLLARSLLGRQDVAASCE